MRENIHIKRLLIFKEKQLLFLGVKSTIYGQHGGSDSYSMAQQTPASLTAKTPLQLPSTSTQ